MSDTTNTDAQQQQQQPPASPPPSGNTETNQTPPANSEANRQQENEAAKFRRLFEKAEADRKQLADEKAEREKSELSELDKLKQEVTEAKERAEKLERENLRRKVAQQHHLTAEATEFLTGDTEDELSERAAKLAGLIRVPASAGTTTNPGGAQTPSIDDRIAAATKAGDRATAITLMRQKAGFGRQAE